MTNGRLETIDGRPALRFERRLDHSVERVWRAITEPEELARWFVARVEWTPKLGERFEAMDQAGEITELGPQRILAYTWGGERFRFELRPEGAGCVLVFSHVFDDRTLGAQHATGWELHLDRLDAFLAGGRILSEDALMRAFPELHERYAERFGLDPEVGRRTFAAMQAERKD
jgi:uncharacterized protein YndB with AHSA1/START domain